jgi:UDP:flavonoid glycosyltransferase YjiC (YdhE family)
MSKESLPDSVYMVDSVPHTWLLPRVAAVIHHGGAGTTAAGLSAGVPSIVTPFMGDQAFWANRVFELGVGPKPIARRHLSVSHLSDAIATALGDDAMRQRAVDLGSRIRSEDGVANAVALVQRVYPER